MLCIINTHKIVLKFDIPDENYQMKTNRDKLRISMRQTLPDCPGISSVSRLVFKEIQEWSNHFSNVLLAGIYTKHRQTIWNRYAGGIRLFVRLISYCSIHVNLQAWIYSIKYNAKHSSLLFGSIHAKAIEKGLRQ